MKVLKIGITGKMGSGKSSLTKFLKEQENCYVTSFSSVIRKTLNNLDLIPTRELMQATGDFFRDYDKLVWVRQLLKEVKDVTNNVIIEGIRYDFESNELASQGFKIIKVLANDEIRRKRIANRSNISIDDQTWSVWQNHPTEVHVDQIISDFTIDNNDSIKDLNQKILAILNKLKKSH